MKLLEKTNQKKGSFHKNPLNKVPFVESLYDYPEGVDVEIKYISRAFPDKFNSEKDVMYLNLLIGDMPECLAFVVNPDSNEFEQVQNKYGVLVNKTTKIVATGKMVAIPLSLTKDLEGGDGYYINTFKSYYQIFKRALVKAGKIPSDYEGAFVLDYNELKEVLVGFKFRLSVRKSTANGIKPYDIFEVVEEGQ